MPRISVSVKDVPDRPSTLTIKPDLPPFHNEIELMRNDLSLRLYTLSVRVEVPSLVNIVSRLTVSAENVNTSLGDVVKLSSMHAVNNPDKHHSSINMGNNALFIHYINAHGVVLLYGYRVSDVY